MSENKCSSCIYFLKHTSFHSDEPAEKEGEVKPEGEETEKLEAEQEDEAAPNEEETKSTTTDGRKVS